jgi:ankyrin repeat protein
MSHKQPKRKERPGLDRMGRSPLHYAALEGNVESVRALLASGLIADALDDDGMTPLHFAVQSKVADVVALLLKAGVSADTPDTQGNTPLSTAVFNSCGNGDIIKLLRTHGADPYAKNIHGVSPFSLARTITNYDVRQFFNDLPEE